MIPFGRPLDDGIDETIVFFVPIDDVIDVKSNMEIAKRKRTQLYGKSTCRQKQVPSGHEHREGIEYKVEGLLPQFVNRVRFPESADDVRVQHGMEQFGCEK
jgi:hypothetical protein